VVPGDGNLWGIVTGIISAKMPGQIESALVEVPTLFWSRNRLGPLTAPRLFAGTSNASGSEAPRR
jgi:hypothetical protein